MNGISKSLTAAALATGLAALPGQRPSFDFIQAGRSDRTQAQRKRSKANKRARQARKTNRVKMNIRKGKGRKYAA